MLRYGTRLGATSNKHHAKTRDTLSIANLSLCISGTDSYLDFRWTGVCIFMWRKSRKHDLSIMHDCHAHTISVERRSKRMKPLVGLSGSRESIVIPTERHLQRGRGLCQPGSFHFQPHRVLSTEFTEDSTNGAHGLTGTPVL
jgi:hypothetical protein